MSVREATFRQRMGLYKFTRINNKGVDIDYDTAHALLARAFNGEDITADVQKLIGQAPSRPTAETVDFQAVYNEAVRAAEEAASKEEHYPYCGFAWVNIKPARGAFITWLKKNNIGHHDSYYGGWTIWSKARTQSMNVNEAWARAFAQSIREQLGLNVRMQSRAD